MQRAWQQVQKVYEANRTIRGVQFMLQVCTRYTSSSSPSLPPARLLAVTSSIHAKVLGSPTTIRQQLHVSRLRAPVFGSAFRRLVRPAGKLAQRLNAQGMPLRLRTAGRGGEQRRDRSRAAAGGSGRTAVG